MPYLGHAPTNSGNFYILDDFNGLGQDGGTSTYDQNANGTIVNFKLMVAGVEITPNVDNLIVTIDGVLQHPTDAYTISGSILTFTGAPASGVDFHVVIMGQSSTVGEGSIGADELQVSGDGTNNQLLKSDGDGTMSWINQNTVTASTAATLATARTIGGVSFDGSANIAVTLAATATTLATARAINGVNFDGSAAITVTADANTLSNTTLKSTVVTSSLTSVGTLTSLRVGSGSTTGWANADELIVEGSANAGINIITGASSTGYIAFGDSGDAGEATIGFTHGSGQKFNFSANGNSEITILDGDLFIDRDGKGLRWSDDKTGIFGNGDSTSSTTNNFIKFVTADSERMRIDGNGNVGIGQATPQTDNSTARFLHIGDSGDGSAGLVIEDNERQWEIQNNGNLNFMSGTTNMLGIRGDNGNAMFGGNIICNEADGQLILANGSEVTRAYLQYQESNDRLIISSSEAGSDMLFLPAGNTALTLTAELDATFAGNVELNSDSTRFKVGASDDCQFFHNGTETYIQNTTGHFYLHNNVANKDIKIHQEGAGGGVKISTNNTIAVDIDNSHNATFYGHILPSANNTKALGQDGNMWDVLWTNEINASSDGIVYMCNSGGTLQVDGKTGIGGVCATTDSPLKLTSAGRYVEIGALNTSHVHFITNVDASSDFYFAGGVEINGSLSKLSGSFKIPHPLPVKNETHNLIHSFVESPQADNIYRGQVDLVGGTATVNIDTIAGMTDGTFVVLNREIQCFTSNESGWIPIKGAVAGNILTITAEDNSCTDTIHWLVIGERKDQHMYDREDTDSDGKIILEPEVSDNDIQMRALENA